MTTTDTAQRPDTTEPTAAPAHTPGTTDTTGTRGRETSPVVRWALVLPPLGALVGALFAVSGR